MARDDYQEGAEARFEDGARERGLGRYLRIARSHWLLMLAIVVVAVAGGFGFWRIQGDSYTSEALIIVSPVARDDELYNGLPVLRESSAPTRDVETVARLIETVQVATAAKAILQSDETPQALLSDIEASPIAQSFLVAVSGTADTAEEASQLANAFARGTIEVRNEQFQQQVDRVSASLEAQIESGTADAVAQRRLVDLESLGGVDPTVQLETAAAPPTDPSSPGLALVLGAAFLIGLVCAFFAALAVEATNVRVRSDFQLTDRFRAPVLARIPRMRRVKPWPGPVSPEAAESYRTLRQNFAVLRGHSGAARSTLLTGTTPGEGRTTVAVNTARSLAKAGYHVILVDADGRRSRISEWLSGPTSTGLTAVLAGESPLEDALVSIGDYPGSLDVLVHGERLSRDSDLSINQESIGRLVAAAGRRADFVIFDAPPLGAVADALPIATAVDDVIVVARKGQTRIPDVQALLQLLGRYQVTPRGFVLVGAGRRGGGELVADRTPAEGTGAEQPGFPTPGGNGQRDSPEATPTTR